MRDLNNSNRYPKRPSVDRRRALLIEGTAGSRRFIRDTNVNETFLAPRREKRKTTA